MPLNLTLKPAQVELISLPGSSVTQAYNIINNSDTTIVLYSNVLPFAPVDNNGSVTYENVTPSSQVHFSLANADLQLGQTFTLKPNENRQLVLKIQSDQNTPLKDFYFTFFVNQNIGNDNANEFSASAATARVGSHILLSTSKVENTNSTFTVSRFNVSPKFKDILYPQLTFKAEVNNQSNYYNKIVGKLTISKNDLLIKEFELYPSNVLAHSSREIQCLSNNEPTPCSITPPFWPGQYKAVITLDSALSTKPVSISFFIFPYSFLFIALVVTAILLIIFRKKQ